MDLNAYRQQIDDIDRELLDLFLRRMTISREIAAFKVRSGLPVFHPHREEEILRWAGESAGELGPYARELFAKIMGLSRQIQSRLVEEAGPQWDAGAEKDT